MGRRTGLRRKAAAQPDALWFRMFGRMSGQKGYGSSTIRQENTVCYSKNHILFVRHEPDIPEP